MDQEDNTQMTEQISKNSKADPAAENAEKKADPLKPKEIGGPKGPEPTRYGDWERKGIVSDF